ncbi:EAL domain-containing protein [Pseudocitrobacter faecalis]|uniref:cyclic-guanylate-specific phosphodiesterase n=1 Tax=Pseudocitrobacter faecalis TaxID=1398493 RepID=A0ABX9G7R2_9ENTR|nr:EAL domain-containing protein (putative c-di-GMP-specific phosphodiesterase class I) [Pseudocitrobacter faecalis]
MQSAHWIVKQYLHKRILLCVLVALGVFSLTLGIGFILQRSENKQQIESYTLRAVTTMEKILRSLEKERIDLQPLIGKPCNDNLLQLRQQVATLKTARSIFLVKDGILYCSSAFGERNIPLRKLQPRLAASTPNIILTIDRSLVKGSPVLMQWFPAAQDDRNGVVIGINIDLVSEMILDPFPPLITRTSLGIDNAYYMDGVGISEQRLQRKGEMFYSQASRAYPFSIAVSGPSFWTLALHELPGRLPLALILSLLFAWITWIATARRMSFSWEINMGIAQREFTLFCQPLMNTRAQRCDGVEILLRWNNPRLGPIAPDVFIPIAEAKNLILPLTRYVLNETAQQLHYFPADPKFHIGINAAAAHFRDDKLLLADLNNLWFSVNPTVQLTIELTERDALHDVNSKLLRELHSKKVQLAIDDFGTGNSSLSWLEKLHPDVLKIDKSFTHAIGTDAVNSTVTDIIIALGQRLNIELVAEGVETPEQANYLQRHGVHLLQGYLYAPPMPLAEFPQWLAKHNGLPPPAMP